jgi:hypothetical protein
MAQFAQQQAGGSAQPQAGGEEELLKGMFGQMGQLLTGAAQILSVKKPQLLPILKQAVQALAMVQSEIAQKPEGAAGGGVNPQPQGTPAGVSAG